MKQTIGREGMAGVIGRSHIAAPAVVPIMASTKSNSTRFNLGCLPAPCHAHQSLSLWFLRELTVRDSLEQWTDLLFPNLAEGVVLQSVNVRDTYYP